MPFKNPDRAREYKREWEKQHRRNSTQAVRERVARYDAEHRAERRLAAKIRAIRQGRTEPIAISYFVVPGLKTLSGKILKNELGTIRQDIVIKQIETIWGLPIDVAKRKTRKRELVEFRHVAMSILYEYTDISLKDVGIFFKPENGKPFDHTTVIHAIGAVKDESDTNKAFRLKLNRLHRAIQRFHKI